MRVPASGGGRCPAGIRVPARGARHHGCCMQAHRALMLQRLLHGTRSDIPQSDGLASRRREEPALKEGDCVHLHGSWGWDR